MSTWLRPRACRKSFAKMLARVSAVTAPLMQKVSPVTTVVSSKAAALIAIFNERLQEFLPLGTKIFHYGKEKE